MKLYYVKPEGNAPPLLDFIDTLDAKLRQKLLQQFSILITTPMPREPTIKHFSLERYSKLYELRARIKMMVRIIFTIRDDGGILFLTPFIKKQSRDTMTALDASLKQLAQVNDGSCPVSELTVNMIKELSEYDKNTG